MSRNPQKDSFLHSSEKPSILGSNHSHEEAPEDANFNAGLKKKVEKPKIRNLNQSRTLKLQNMQVIIDMSEKWQIYGYSHNKLEKIGEFERPLRANMIRCIIVGDNVRFIIADKGYYLAEIEVSRFKIRALDPILMCNRDVKIFCKPTGNLLMIWRFYTKRIQYRRQKEGYDIYDIRPFKPNSHLIEIVLGNQDKQYEYQVFDIRAGNWKLVQLNSMNNQDEERWGYEKVFKRGNQGDFLYNFFLNFVLDETRNSTKKNRPYFVDMYIKKYNHVYNRKKLLSLILT